MRYCENEAVEEPGEALAVALYERWASFNLMSLNALCPRWRYLRPDIQEAFRDLADKLIDNREPFGS